MSLLPATGFTTTGDVVEDPPGTYSLLGDATFNNYVASGPHNWTGKEATLEVASFPRSTGLQLNLEARGNSALVQLLDSVSGTIDVRLKLAGATVGSSFVWDSTSMRWVMLAYEGTDVVCRTSADGLAWTEQRRAAATAPTAVNMRVYAHNANGGTNRISVRSLNTAPAPSVPVSPPATSRIFIGGTALKARRIGGTAVRAIYRGSTLLWGEAQEVQVDDTAVGTGDLQFDYSAGWQTSATEHYTSTPGSTATLRFTGTSAVLYGTTDAHHGQASVSLDGGAAVAVNCQSAGRVANVGYYSTGTLADGPHTIVLTAPTDGKVVALDHATVLSTTGGGSTPTDPGTSTGVLLDDQFASAYTLSSSNNGTHPWLRCEGGDPTQTISGGTFKVTATGAYVRQFSNFRFGGLNKRVVISFRARVNALDSTSAVNGTWPGMKLGWKVKCPNSTTYSDTDWRSVDAAQNPGSFIFVHGLGAQGRTELARNKACVTGYESDFFSSTPGYTPGTWKEGAVVFEHVGADVNERRWRVRYYANTTATGTPYFDQTVDHPTLPVQPGFLWLRTDFCSGEYDWIRIEESAL